MRAIVLNLGTTSPDDDVFLSGPKVSLAAGESMTWEAITVADLDSDAQLKGLQLDGKVSVTIELDEVDRAVAAKGTMRVNLLPRYTVATLPTGADAINGMVAYATNGRSGAEGVGVGTGVPVIYTNAQWRRFEDMAVVAA